MKNIVFGPKYCKQHSAFRMEFPVSSAAQTEMLPSGSGNVQEEYWMLGSFHGWGVNIFNSVGGNAFYQQKVIVWI